ncbi:hypothetical protein LEAN103870_01200 [Legionella anisa]
MQRNLETLSISLLLNFHQKKPATAGFLDDKN